MREPLQFDYALRFPNGLYYTGRVNSDAEPNAWQGPKEAAFTYSERGAYRKKEQIMFSLCEVVRIL